MKILMIKLSALGDVIHTLPSLAALRRCFPEARIDWVVEEAAAGLLADHPDLNRLIVSRRKSWIRELRRGRLERPLGEMRAFLRELRAVEYDLVIDFHGLFKSAVLAAASRSRRKLGYASLQELSGLFYRERIPEDMKKHAVDRYLDFVRHVAGEAGRQCLSGPPVFTVAVGPAQERRVEELLAEGSGRAGGGTPVRRPFVAVSPVALWETKLWDEGKFASLCDRIKGELDLEVLLTGAEPEPLARIAAAMKARAMNLGGRTTLRELAALYRRARLVVSTDSGPMHLAAAMGTPVVAIFGPTDPARTGPYGEGHRVVRAGSPCSPCFKKRCADPRCMRDITVEAVLEAVREQLRKEGGRDGDK